MRKRFLILFTMILAVALIGCSNSKDDSPKMPDETLSEATAAPLTIDPDHEHLYITKVVDPTCEGAGYTVYTCECGDTYEDYMVDAYGHDYVSNVVTPTKRKQGYTEYTCITCSNTYQDNFVEKLASKDRAEPHSHIFELKNVAPTCFKKGYSLSVCSCGQSNLVEGSYVDALGHKYETAVISPTCSKQGYTVHKCTSCSSTYNDNYTNATGHKYVEQVIKEPTCTVDGTQTSICTVCNCQDTSKDLAIPALGHDFSIVGTVVEPSCIEKGFTAYQCSRCSNHKKDNETEALEHNYIITEETPATCETAGSQIYTCTRCTDRHSKSVKATGHVTYKTVEAAPTCTACAKTNVVCTACDKILKSTDNTNNPALGHDWKVSSNTASCTSNGTKTYSCTRCTETKSEPANATGSHSYETAIVSTAAKDFSTNRGYGYYDEYLGYSDIACDRCKNCYEIDVNSFRIKYSQSEIANTMLSYVNALRVENGLNELTVSSSLNATADTRAQQISVSFSSSSGIENITKDGGVSNCIKRAYDAFLNSASHKANMLNANINYFGCDIYYSNGKTYCVQLFG